MIRAGHRRPIRTPKDPAYLRDLFSTSARYYEWVNAVTSLGQVVLWRREVIRAARLSQTDKVLDAFCGPGSLALYAAPHMSGNGRLVLADLSPVMLDRARARLAAETSHHSNPPPAVDYVAGDLLHDDLGLTDFDVVLLGWGLRYVENVPETLARVRSFLRPGGRLVVLEFTRPAGPSLATPAQWYFRHVLPAIGSLLARDRELHEYLSVSAAEFRMATELAKTIEETGFALESRRSHLGGLVTIVAAIRTEPRPA